MKSMKRLSVSAGLLLTSATVWAHPGHEAVGDGLHIEYLVAVGLVGSIALVAWLKNKQDSPD